MVAFLYADTLRAKQKGECVKLQVVQWAGCAGTGTFHDVEVDHGCGDIGMAEEALDGPDVRSGFQQMGGKAVAEGMRGDSLGDSRFAHALAQLAGHGVVMEMVSGDFSGAWVRAEGGGRKEVLIRHRPTAPHPPGFTSLRPKGLHAFSLFAMAIPCWRSAICAGALQAYGHRPHLRRDPGDVFHAVGRDVPGVVSQGLWAR